MHTVEGTKFTKENNPNKGYEDGSRVVWNKGLTKDTDERVKSHALNLSSRYKSGELIGSSVGREVSEETKKKISLARIKFLTENPDKVPYLLNHYSKGESYPEQYFREVLENNSIVFKQEVREKLYSLDFVINKINLEIDGEQHYVDNKIVESDKRRTKYLESIGYKTLRVRWAHYMKLNREDKEKFIIDLIAKLL